MFLKSSFPDSWKKTRVIVLPKRGSKGFRPIALTLVFPKIFEKFVHRRLEHEVESRDLFPPQQFGFRKGKSAVDWVATFVADKSAGFLDSYNTFAISINIK